MANALRGEVPLSGTEYVLRYDVNELCEVESAAKDNILAVLTRLQDGTPPSFTTIRLLLWAGLRAGKPEMRLEEAGRIIQEVGLQTAVEAIGEAFKASFPPPGDTESPNP